MNIFRFLDWKVYGDAKRLNRYVGSISDGFSLDVRKKYHSQFNRAALSISLNIAEAAGRYTDTEMARFLDFSLGSSAELVACADNLKDEGYVSETDFLKIFEQTREIAKQIQGLKNSIYKNSKIYNKRVQV